MNAFSKKATTTYSDWSTEEVSLVVADYFEMLRTEMLEQPYNKTDHRRRLRPRLSSRNDASIEFKHQNISAVLVHLGYPYIDGYKPRGNYQALLLDGVLNYLKQHSDFFEQLSNTPSISPQKAPQIDMPSVARLFEPAPDKIGTPAGAAAPWVLREGLTTDFVQKDADNRRLGKMGEQFVVDVEKHRLTESGRDDLASRVEWIAQTRGDGIGFDVLSFDEDESERLIEVKTTGLGKFFPFYVTSNEVRCSEACTSRFHLYRVFRFSKAPRLYILQGAISQTCRLEPMQFRATFG